MYEEKIHMSWDPKSPNVWTIEEEYIVTCENHLYSVPKGYVTDFTSIPRLFLSILPKWSDYARAAVVHDYLYSTHHLIKKDADLALYSIMKMDKVNKRQAFLIYWAVRLFGKSAWDEAPDR